LLDSAAFHLGYGHFAVFEDDTFATPGDFAEAHQEEAGEGFYSAFAGQSPLHLSFEIAQVDGAFEKKRTAGGGEDGAGGVVEFVVEFAGELFDGVLDGDQADGRAVLVDDDGQLAAALLEFLDQIQDGFGFGDHEDVAHDLAEAQLHEWRSGNGRGGGACASGAAEVHEAGEVFGVNDADDMFGAAGLVVDGDAAVLVIDDAGTGGFNEHVGGERDDFLAGGHNFADRGFVEFQGAMDESLLKWWQNAHAAGGCCDELEFFRRVH